MADITILSWITAEPGAMPVTCTFTLVAFAGKFTVAGTVAAAVLLELRLTVTPAAGAGAERFSARFCEVAPVIVRFCGEKLSVAVTCTGCVADV